MPAGARFLSNSPIPITSPLKYLGNEALQRGEPRFKTACTTLIPRVCKAKDNSFSNSCIFHRKTGAVDRSLQFIAKDFTGTI